MPFNPINLGNILQQGEAIQGARLNNLRIGQALDPNSPQNQLLNLQVEARRLENKVLQNPSSSANIGTVNPRDFTAGSISNFQETGDFNALERFTPPKSPFRVDTGDAIEFYSGGPDNTLLRTIPKSLAPKDELSHIESAAAARATGSSGVELETKPAIAAAETSAKANASRQQEFIDKGVTAGDAYPTIARGLSLLRGGVETGGFARAKLAATNFFGVTGADETELSNNLGKAVLSQLRETFGAAFTAKEGEQLQTIEANYGKSTAGNIRLLEQAERIVKRAAKRGMAAAKAAGDETSASEIEKALSTSFEENTMSDEDYQTRKKALLGE